MKTRVDIATNEERDFSHLLVGSERFERLGITFKLPKMEDEERIWKFFVEEFIPDEPLSR